MTEMTEEQKAGYARLLALEALREELGVYPVLWEVPRDALHAALVRIRDQAAAYLVELEPQPEAKPSPGHHCKECGENHPDFDCIPF